MSKRKLFGMERLPSKACGNPIGHWCIKKAYSCPLLKKGVRVANSLVHDGENLSVVERGASFRKHLGGPIHKALPLRSLVDPCPALFQDRESSLTAQSHIQAWLHGGGLLEACDIEKTIKYATRGDGFREAPKYKLKIRS